MKWIIEKGINVFFFVISMKDIQNAKMCVIMPYVSASVILSYLHSRLHVMKSHPSSS